MAAEQGALGSPDLPPVRPLAAVEGEKAPAPEGDHEGGQVHETQHGDNTGEEDRPPELGGGVESVTEQISPERSGDGEERQRERKNDESREAQNARRP